MVLQNRTQRKPNEKIIIIKIKKYKKHITKPNQNKIKQTDEQNNSIQFKPLKYINLNGKLPSSSDIFDNLISDSNASNNDENATFIPTAKHTKMSNKG